MTTGNLVAGSASSFASGVMTRAFRPTVTFACACLRSGAESHISDGGDRNTPCPSGSRPSIAPSRVTETFSRSVAIPSRMSRTAAAARRFLTTTCCV
jgi:hypothetical protein